MRISTRGKNAIKFMLDLALHCQGEPVKVKDIAERYNISEKYLQQVVVVLNKALLVKSVRGARGGYMLRFPPEKYTVGQILKAVEGNMSLTNCADENDQLCENKADRACFQLWEKLDKAVNDVLEGITLADMLKWQNDPPSDRYVV